MILSHSKISERSRYARLAHFAPPSLTALTKYIVTFSTDAFCPDLAPSYLKIIGKSRFARPVHFTPLSHDCSFKNYSEIAIWWAGPSCPTQKLWKNLVFLDEAILPRSPFRLCYFAFWCKRLLNRARRKDNDADVPYYKVVAQTSSSSADDVVGSAYCREREGYFSLRASSLNELFSTTYSSEELAPGSCSRSIKLYAHREE